MDMWQLTLDWLDDLPATPPAATEDPPRALPSVEPVPIAASPDPQSVPLPSPLTALPEGEGEDWFERLRDVVEDAVERSVSAAMTRFDVRGQIAAALARWAEQRRAVMR
jgi:hypothetical protein